MRVVHDLKKEGVPDERLGLIYNGVDMSLFENRQQEQRKQNRKELELKDDTLVLTILANLIPYKGHDDLLEAIGMVRSRMPPDWVLLIAGRDDGIGAALAEKVQAMGISSHVRFMGGAGICRGSSMRQILVYCARMRKAFRMPCWR